jgi:hypothetical protein
MKKIFTIIISLFIISTLFLVIGCEKDDGNNIPDTPPITTTTTGINSNDIDFSMRFGVGAHIYPSTYTSVQQLYTATREVDKLGYVWLRHPGNGIAWYEIQPTRDTWNFEKLDAVINNNKHPWLMALYGMVGNVYPYNGFDKDYARTLGDKANVIDYIISHSLDLTDPQQKEDAKLFVKTVVNRYKDTIKYWEIGGNEGLPAPEKFDYIYNTYIWIKEADPTAQVLITANCGDGDWAFYDNIEALDSIFAKGATDSFDIANFHYYGYIDGDDFEEMLETRYDEYKAKLDKYGINKPIWITETGTCSESDSVISPGGTELRQAQDIVKRFAIFSAKGAEKVFWYSYGNQGQGDLFKGCNLVEGNTKKPGYYNLKLMVDKFGHFETATKLRGDNVWIIKFVNPDKSSVYVAWAKTPETVDLSLYLGKSSALATHIIEDRGTSTHDTETVDTTSVTLTESPVFLE